MMKRSDVYHHPVLLWHFCHSGARYKSKPAYLIIMGVDIETKLQWHFIK